MSEKWSASEYLKFVATKKQPLPRKETPYTVKSKPTRGTKADYKGHIWDAINRISKGWVTEYKFHPKRKWRADYALVDKMLLIEYEGIFGGKSRHTNNIGYVNDAEKYNAAQILGFTVLRYTAMNYKNVEQDVIDYLNNRTK